MPVSTPAIPGSNAELHILTSAGEAAGTGTITSSGTAVTGSTTSFTGEVAEGDVIGAAVSGVTEYRRVDTVTDNTNLVLNRAFSADIASAASFVILKFELLEGVSNLTPPQIALNESEVPALGNTSGFIPKIATLSSIDAMSFDFYYQPLKIGHQRLRTLAKTKAVTAFMVWFGEGKLEETQQLPPDNFNSSEFVRGQVGGFATDIPGDGPVSTSVEVSPSTLEEFNGTGA